MWQWVSVSTFDTWEQRLDLTNLCARGQCAPAAPVGLRVQREAELRGDPSRRGRHERLDQVGDKSDCFGGRIQDSRETRLLCLVAGQEPGRGALISRLRIEAVADALPGVCHG